MNDEIINKHATRRLAGGMLIDPGIQKAFISYS
jgi:hypothetical protein